MGRLLASPPDCSNRHYHCWLLQNSIQHQQVLRLHRPHSSNRPPHWQSWDPMPTYTSGTQLLHSTTQQVASGYTKISNLSTFTHHLVHSSTLTQTQTQLFCSNCTSSPHRLQTLCVPICPSPSVWMHPTLPHVDNAQKCMQMCVWWTRYVSTIVCARW